ncbi:MAG: YhcH/YjgK/YiaL family protein [Proteobacteria bacterium]|nr:YhcH/YjgK/YiaL family protein [Pseudomonadota bacterium]MBU1611448.1 YhcH/YjgK/YiaL family protein [Pseudomonadota bacterium]
MILDQLTRHQDYHALHPAFAKAFAFLLRQDLAELQEGRNEIDSDQLYAMVAKGKGRARSEAELEVHDAYIDIQLVLSGTDEMGWKPRQDCAIPSPEASDPSKDVFFFKDTPETWLRVEPGRFAIFFPEDAHLPMTGPSEMHKVIVKVRV